MSAVTINFAPAIAMTDEQFYELCQANRDLKFERSANGDLILMPPQAEQQVIAMPLVSRIFRHWLNEILDYSRSNGSRKHIFGWRKDKDTTQNGLSILLCFC